MMVITKPDPDPLDIENSDTSEGVDAELIPALHADADADAVGRVQVREEQCSRSIRIRRKNPCTIRRPGCVQTAAISVLLLSTFVASVIYFEMYVYARHSSLVTGFGRVFGPSHGEKGKHENVGEPSALPSELGTREDILSSIILRRHEDERRFQRQEENLRRERLGKIRHSRMEAQEEKRMLIEEQKKVMKEKMLKVQQQQDEDKLRREEERMLKKERLAIEREARIDAREERTRMSQDLQRSENQAITPLEQSTESEVTEDELQPHVRRKALLYTFAY